MQEQKTPEEKLKGLKIVWLMMLASKVFYFVVATMGHKSAEVQARSPIANLVWGVAIVCVGMAFVAPNLTFKRDAGAGPDQKVQLQVLRYTFFDAVGIFALINFLGQGVSLTEFSIGILISFALTIAFPPKLA